MTIREERKRVRFNKASHELLSVYDTKSSQANAYFVQRVSNNQMGQKKCLSTSHESLLVIITCGADGAADDEGELEEEEEDAEEADDDGLHRDPVQLGILVPDLQTIRN